MNYNFDEPVIRRGTDSKKYLQAAEDVLPMWLADTDFRCPQPVIDACVRRMQEGVYGYPDVSSEFKEAIAFWQKTRFGWDVSADWVEFVPGVIPGIICAVRALSQVGDNVAMLSPAYPQFNDLTVHNGRNVLRSALKVRNGQYAIDFEDLEETLSQERTRLFLFCNPHNPAGRVFTKEEMVKIGELCRRHDVLILSDEIHEDIVYKGNHHCPIASVNEDL
ncbi:MAG: aminotransferase class I/II-fold pyridoxal phosphate-dependent enzyme, partial [Eubacterium sp.]|nr:aminotransferase class I/II-fold pyridoxal phosphate-dependent enzyme [Eubacterium sp.]